MERWGGGVMESWERRDRLRLRRPAFAQSYGPASEDRPSRRATARQTMKRKNRIQIDYEDDDDEEENEDEDENETES